eukprot:scaffold42258_cov71-Cyclotella_meneghiniana.AAC.6
MKCESGRQEFFKCDESGGRKKIFRKIFGGSCGAPRAPGGSENGARPRGNSGQCNTQPFKKL